MRHHLIPLCLAALCLWTSSVGAQEKKAKRNVVLLVADDLGLQLGCYGDKVAKTPRLDALAKEGTRFKYAFTTVASCSPSRSVIYTGLYTHSNGQYGLAHAGHNFHTKSNVRSLPYYLQLLGYKVGIIAKNHVIPQSVYPWDEELKSSGRNGVAMAKQAQKFIEGAGDKPFCLVFGFTHPHRAAKGFGNDADHPGIKAEKFDPKTVPVPAFLPDQAETRADLAEYYQAVNRLDQGVGAVLDMLARTGRDKDTLVIFLSDNGIPFPGAKTTVYDAGLHLPLIVRKPGQRPTVSQAMVSWIDVLPTILDWAGSKPVNGMQGRSFLGIVEQQNPRGWDEVYASHTFHEVTMYYPMRSVRTRKYHYVKNLANRLSFPFASDLYGSPTWQAVLKNDVKMMGKRTTAAYLNRPEEELYDLENDPDEVKNLAGDRAHAQTLAELRKKVSEWREKTGDPWTIKDRHE